MKTKLFILYLLIFSLSTEAQLTEKHLKLNRIIAIDSSKSFILPSNLNPNLLYTIKVPQNTYWKITKLCSKPLNLVSGLAQSQIAYINSAYFYFTSASSEATCCLFEAPIWLNPNTEIKIMTKLNGMTVTETLFLNAEEYFLE